MKTKLIIVLLSIILLSNIIVNANNVTTKKEGESTNTNFFNNYDYIIITSNSFKNYNGENSFQALCDYHEEHSNLKTTIETVENIRSSYQGYDDAEKILNYIRDKNPTYVLLGGDSDTIPIKKLHLYTEYDNFFKRLAPTVSDVYYSCPEDDWSSTTESYLPEDRNLNGDESDLPNMQITGGGFFNEEIEIVPEGIKATYKEGSADENGYINISFDQPIDLSDMYWLCFDIYTDLKDYPLENGYVGESGIVWNNFYFVIECSNNVDSISFITPICEDGVDPNEWANFELSCQRGDSPVYTKPKYTEVTGFDIWIRKRHLSNCDENEVYLESGNHVIINNLHFYDYNPNSVINKDGSFDSTVCLGRACVDSTSDIQNFVKKTLNYLDPEEPNINYLENAVLLNSIEQDNTLKKINNNYLESAGYSSQEFYGTGSLSAVRDILFNVDENEDTNAQLLLYIGHGTPKGEYGGEYGNVDFITRDDIDQFNNKNTFFEFSSACNTGAFNKNDCYAEHLTVKSEYGAFAGIWHTKPGYSSYIDKALDRFFKAICLWDYTIGEAHRYLKNDITDPGRYTHTLFGDPAIKIKKPIDISIPDKPSTPEGDTEITVSEEVWFQTRSISEYGQIRYGWDWDGDNIVDEWTNFYGSAVEISTSHIWENEGIFEIKVIAENKDGYRSDWSDPLEVNATKGKVKIKTIELPLFRLFLEKLSNFFPILKEFFK